MFITGGIEDLNKEQFKKWGQFCLILLVSSAICLLISILKMCFGGMNYTITITFAVCSLVCGRCYLLYRKQYQQKLNN